MKSLIQRLKRFSDDERGVSPVVGFVLIFALIMIVFTIYQASVVPAQNERVEFEHSQMVDGQMHVLNDKIGDVAMTGTPLSVTVDTGVQYPARALAINPGNPVGNLHTTGKQDITIDLSGSEHSIDRTLKTRFVSYQPNYNLQQEETEYISENGMLVKDYSSSDNTGLASKGVMFSDSEKKVNLVLINGSYSANQATSSLRITPVATNTTSLGAGDTGTITLPTSLSDSQWEELVSDKSYVIFEGLTRNPNGFNTVTLGIKAETTIQVNKVTAGNPDEDPAEQKLYLENVTALERNATVNETKEFTVRVRDQYGAPVSSDASISVTTSGAGNLTPTTQTANDDGEATFRYTGDSADSGSTVTVTVASCPLWLNGPVTDTVWKRSG